jgi:hypothetical protein
MNHRQRLHYWAPVLGFCLLHPHHIDDDSLTKSTKQRRVTSLRTAREADDGASICDLHWFLIREPSESVMNAPSQAIVNQHKKKQDKNNLLLIISGKWIWWIIGSHPWRRLSGICQSLPTAPRRSCCHRRIPPTHPSFSCCWALQVWPASWAKSWCPHSLGYQRKGQMHLLCSNMIPSSDLKARSGCGCWRSLEDGPWLWCEGSSSWATILAQGTLFCTRNHPTNIPFAMADGQHLEAKNWLVYNIYSQSIAPLFPAWKVFFKQMNRIFSHVLYVRHDKSTCLSLRRKCTPRTKASDKTVT